MYRSSYFILFFTKSYRNQDESFRWQLVPTIWAVIILIEPRHDAIFVETMFARQKLYFLS